MKFKKPVLILILFVLIAAAINFPFATFFLKSRTDAKGVAGTRVVGPEAVALGWPTDTPHETEWPQPGLWQDLAGAIPRAAFDRAGGALALRQLPPSQHQL